MTLQELQAEQARLQRILATSRRNLADAQATERVLKAHIARHVIALKDIEREITTRRVVG